MAKIALLILTLGLALPACRVAASAGRVEGKVILIIADYLSVSDVVDSPYPAIRRLSREGGVGIVAPPVGASIASTYASAGAGAASWANDGVGHAFSNHETITEEFDSAGAIFERRTGNRTSPEVVHLNLPMFVTENRERLAVSLPGALGNALARAGKKTAVFGNADLAERARRSAAVIAATEDGAIAFGDVSANLLRRATFSPTGFMLDSDILARKVIAALSFADFVVVDFGDTARVELSKRQLSERAYGLHRKNAIANLNNFILRILDGPGGDATIILASLSPPIAKPGSPMRLAPIVVHRPGGTSGSVTSATTRTMALISGFDLAPTVLAELGVDKPGGMIGSRVDVVSAGLGRATRLDEIVAMNRSLLWWVLGVLSAIGMTTITAACVAIAVGIDRAGRVVHIIRILLVVTLSSPLAMLFATGGEATVGAYIVRLVVWMSAITSAAFAGATALRRVMGERVERMPGALPVVVLAILTSIVIFVDACTAGSLARVSLLGSCGFSGFRFYGIGNEYMGVWLAMSIISVVWLRELVPGWEYSRARKAMMLLVCAVTVLGLGLPWLGANAGGMVTAVVAFGLIYLSGIKGRFAIRDVIAVVVVGIALVIGVGLADAASTRGASSHIGRAASMGSRFGWDYIAIIAARKVAMNLSLIATPQARLAIIGSIPFFVLWAMTVGRRVDPVLSRSSSFRWGVMAVIPASLVAFLFNDSGIVAGALIFSFVVTAFVYSALGTQD